MPPGQRWQKLVESEKAMVKMWTTKIEILLITGRKISELSQSRRIEVFLARGKSEPRSHTHPCVSRLR